MVAQDKSVLRANIGRIAAAVACLMLLLGVPFFVRSRFLLHVLIMVLIYGVLGQAWNILGGYAGQVSLGHAVYFAVGAYTSTVLLTTMGVSPWLGMVAGAALAALLSVLVSYPCFRLSGKYYVIASIALLKIMQVALINLNAVGGAAGMLVPILQESLWNLEFHSSKVPYYYVGLAMLGLAIAACMYVDRSKMGYYFRTIKESEIVAESLGIDAVRYKLIAMAMSAVLCSMVGTLYAQYVLYIDPESVVSLPISIKMCLLVVLGGVGTVWGPVLGAAVLVPLSEMTRALLGGSGKGIDLILYGALIVVIILYQPGGVLKILKSISLLTGTRRRGVGEK